MNKTISNILTAVITCLLLFYSDLKPVEAQRKTDKAEGEWVRLFNGENLDGWVAKFAGYELGHNLNNTFRVHDGALTVSYDEWDGWDSEFGHLFYKKPFSHYILRVEYRFVGKQIDGGPDWAFRNNGLMLHCQAPETMDRDQSFPVSIETQLLGGNGTGERTTLNVCTPGTNILMNGELITQHCINSNSKTYHGDQWVTAEVEVRGSKIVRHWIDGEKVFEYTDPQLDKNDQDAKPLIAKRKGNNLLVKKGILPFRQKPTQRNSGKLSLKC